MNKYIVAVDIGSMNINIAVGEIENNNDLNIIKLLTKVTKEKLSRDALKGILGQLFEEAFLGLEIKPQKVYLGVNNSNLRVTESYCSLDIGDSKKVSSSHIKRILKKSISEIPLNRDEEIVDSRVNFFMIDGRSVKASVLGWRGKEVTANVTHIIYKKISLVEEYKEIISELGIQVVHIKSNSISVSSTIQNFEANTLSAMIEIGNSNTNIAIINNGVVIEIMDIPIGGKHISNDIAICCNYPKLEAERLKCILSDRYNISYEEKVHTYIGTTLIDRDLFTGVIDARIKEILSFIKIQLKNTGYYGKINSIILYGDGISNFSGITKKIKLSLGYESYVLTKKSLDLQKSSYINTLAIVKEVYNELKLVYGQDILRYCHDNYKINHIRKMNNWFTKVKKILGEGF